MNPVPMCDRTMNANEHYLGYVCQGHMVSYNSISKENVWVEIKDGMKEEPYIFSNSPTHHIHKGSLLNIQSLSPQAPKQITTTSPSQYQQFLKDKIAEYAVTHPQLTKKERYNLILEEWRTTKQKSKK